MKKVMIALAAVAMVAFAGCKKDSDTITMNVGFNDDLNSVKEGWYNYGNQVVFQAGDMCIVNGTRYSMQLAYDDVTASDPSNFTYSRFATIKMCPDMLHAPAWMLYPSNAFYEDNTYGFGFDLSDMVSMPEPSTPAFYMTSLTSGYSEWPLCAYIPSVANGQTFNLKNTTALVAPAVKWGSDFIGEFNANYGTHFSTSNAKVTVNKVTLYSDQNIAGSGYVSNVETAADANPTCLFVIDENMQDGWANTQIEAVPTYNNNSNNAIIGVSDNYVTVGNIAVPVLTSGYIWMDMEFTITENGQTPKHMLYHSGRAAIGTDLTLVRSKRTTMVANFFSSNPDWNKFEEL